MNREYHRWHSPTLGREMELLIFGHGGARMLAFPTSMGRFYDWEDRGMVGALAEHLANGWIQLYCVDSVDAESWYNRAAPAAERARRHVAYDRYLVEDVLPLSTQKNSTPYLIVAGVGFGGYHAVNFSFRHPDRANRVIGLSGQYDIGALADGAAVGDVYFNNPCAYVANEHDPERLALLRGLDVILGVGRDDPSYRNNLDFSALLGAQGIQHKLRVWGGAAHDWPCWQEAIKHYVSGNASYP
jgi:esterase/lipase superfamily enzyme